MRIVVGELAGEYQIFVVSTLLASPTYQVDINNNRVLFELNRKIRLHQSTSISFVQGTTESSGIQSYLTTSDSPDAKTRPS